MRLPRLREGRQLRGDQHRGDVLQLHAGAGRHRDAHLLQHRVQALRRERGLVVWSPVPSRPTTRP
jgi:hypothetical protein